MLIRITQWLYLIFLLPLQIAFIPKNPQTIGRLIKPLANHYHDLVNVYGNSSSEELRILILKYSEAFMRDNNMGLAKQVSRNSLLPVSPQL